MDISQQRTRYSNQPGNFRLVFPLHFLTLWDISRWLAREKRPEWQITMRPPGRRLHTVQVGSSVDSLACGLVSKTETYCAKPGECQDECPTLMLGMGEGRLLEREGQLECKISKDVNGSWHLLWFSDPLGNNPSNRILPEAASGTASQTWAPLVGLEPQRSQCSSSFIRNPNSTRAMSW